MARSTRRLPGRARAAAAALAGAALVVGAPGCGPGEAGTSASAEAHGHGGEHAHAERRVSGNVHGEQVRQAHALAADIAGHDLVAIGRHAQRVGLDGVVVG